VNSQQLSVISYQLSLVKADVSEQQVLEYFFICNSAIPLLPNYPSIRRTFGTKIRIKLAELATCQWVRCTIRKTGKLNFGYLEL
jgi:hypothetical protein